MHKQKLLSITRSILNQPTAPFHEAKVAAEIQAQLKKCPHVKVQLDKFGNLIALYQRGKAKARFAYVAHMDHPGWVIPPHENQLQFLGGVPKEYLTGGTLKDFGAFAMWDLAAFEIKGDIIYSRACDDLIGCTAIVAMFYELERLNIEGSCYGIFTRAEEVGFVGSVHLAKSGLLAKSLTIISIETSSERPPAKLGAGPIVRVGDRTSIFNSTATAILMSVAQDAKISVQRCLMSGGTCEATAYQLYNYRTAGLCIALGNYHNCGQDQKIQSEYVSFSDLQNLVRLCVNVELRSRDLPDPDKLLTRRLESKLRKYKDYF